MSYFYSTVALGDLCRLPGQYFEKAVVTSGYVCSSSRTVEPGLVAVARQGAEFPSLNIYDVKKEGRDFRGHFLLATPLEDMPTLTFSVVCSYQSPYYLDPSPAKLAQAHLQEITSQREITVSVQGICKPFDGPDRVIVPTIAVHSIVTPSAQFDF